MIRNSILPFKGFSAINLFGILFVRNDAVVNQMLINHEQIHSAQMHEMLYLFFYIWYLIEWIVKLFRYGKYSYDNISFEREAYMHHHDAGYLKNRKSFHWIKYL